jgi:acetyl esterase/lipase
MLLALALGALADLGAYSGNYEVAPGDVIAIAEWEIEPESPHVLFYTRLESGRVGVLTESGPDVFTLASGLMAGAPESTIRFTRSGERVTGLALERAGQAPQRAARSADRREELHFGAGDAQLGATLLLPPGKGPFPAVVLVPAGGLGRNSTATFANFFLSEGFAALACDGRRTGTAGGFERAAADAIAAVELLRLRADIDRAHVGLWGHSRGGWLSLLAASKSDSVAFVIDHSGMLVPALAAGALPPGRGGHGRRRRAGGCRGRAGIRDAAHAGRTHGRGLGGARGPRCAPARSRPGSSSSTGRIRSRSCARPGATTSASTPCPSPRVFTNPCSRCSAASTARRDRVGRQPRERAARRREAEHRVLPDRRPRLPGRGHGRPARDPRR